MLAVSTDDLKVRIVDLATKRLVRVFDGHSNRITDMAMSPDGRWAATVSSDCTMRIYDVPSARLIDWLSFERVRKDHPMNHITSLQPCALVKHTNVNPTMIMVMIAI